MRRRALLLLAAMLATTTVVHAIGLPGTQTAEVAATPEIPALPPAPRHEAARLAAYKVVVERPLFTTSRRPPAPPETRPAAPHTPVPPPDVVVVGIVAGPSVRVALIREKKATILQHVAEGDLIDGWTIDTIQPHRVVLRQHGETHEVPIHDGRKPP